MPSSLVGSRARLVHAPPGVALILVKALGFLVRDVVLTRQEIDGLLAGLLVSDQPPTGATRFSAWLRQNVDAIGRTYAPEVGPHIVRYRLQNKKEEGDTSWLRP
ncbi:MAG: hypothetical protein FJZ89_05690 [Chloroflexi bacterium]|nr:hypothetical protein [Chloroflexota bacterium]